jgi:hypothetical protein
MGKRRLDLSTVVDKRDYPKIEISGSELNQLLQNAWNMGFMTGRNKTEESVREQRNDCLEILHEKHPTLKVEAVEYDVY